MFIGYEAVTSEISDALGRPLVKGYVATICQGVSKDSHRVAFRGPATVLFDDAASAMKALGQELPVLSCRYDEAVWHLLPGESRPSIIDPNAPLGKSVFMFHFFDDWYAEQDQKRQEIENERMQARDNKFTKGHMSRGHRL